MATEARVGLVALDVMARVRAEPQLPLDAVLGAVARERGAGARDRRALGDLVFAWARRRATIEPRVTAAAKAQGGLRPAARDLDRVALTVAAHESDLDVAPALLRALAPELRALHDDVLALPAPSSPLPPWLRARLGRRTDCDVDALAQALQGRAAPVLAIDPSVCSVDDVQAALARTGARAERSPVVPAALRVVEGRLNLAALPAAVREACWLMDDASQAVALAVNPAPGERVLDVCAGGGGKSRMLRARGAEVISADLSRARLARSVEAERVRLVADARALPFRPRAFARVLVDAPCSGTGTLRRAPDLAARLTPDSVDEAVATQRAILAGAAEVLAPGGTLIYATCSLLPEENEDLVAELLRTSPDLAPLPLAPLWGARVVGTQPDATSRTFLPSVDGTDGFFVAALTRRA